LDLISANAASKTSAVKKIAVHLRQIAAAVFSLLLRWGEYQTTCKQK